MTHYFDYASTTPVDPRIAERMAGCLTATGTFGNPASTTHGFGWQASEAVEWARAVIGDCVHADPREIVFTSGATESNNLAIRGSFDALAARSGRRRVITLASEHKAVLDTCRWLSNADLVVMPPRPDGLIDLDRFADVLTADTLLVSVMLVNNETGVVQPIADIARLVHQMGALMHCDMAQAVGKTAVDVQALGVDLASLSAHKCYGPKGVGALFVRRDPAVVVTEQQHGGGHERGMRSGTLPTHQLVGMAEAFELSSHEWLDDLKRIAGYRDRLMRLCERLGGVHVNGALGVPHIVNLTVDGVDAEALMSAMPTIAISTGSACNSATLEPSHVLQSMGLSRAEGLSSVRVSFGRMTTADAVGDLMDAFEKAVTGLRRSS